MQAKVGWKKKVWKKENLKERKNGIISNRLFVLGNDLKSKFKSSKTSAILITKKDSGED